MDDTETYAPKAALMARLRAVGITYVVAEYSGGGDSGQVDGITAYDAAQKALDLGEVREPNPVALQVVAKLENKEHESLQKTVENLVYDALDFVDAGDWCNNDGGDGTLHIYVEAGELDGEPVAAGTIKITHNVNYMKQNTTEYEL